MDKDLDEGSKYVIFRKTNAGTGGHQVPNLTFDKKDDAHSHIKKLSPGDYEVRKGWAGGTIKSRSDKAKNIGIKEDSLSEKRGLWDNIHAKRERIKHGSGEKMRKPGSKGAPTNQAFKDAAEEVQIDEISKSTLGNYVKKSALDIARQTDNRTRAHYGDDDKAFNRAAHKLMNRQDGVRRAVDKMTKEEVVTETSAANKIKKNDAAKSMGAAARKAGDPKHLTTMGTGMRTSVADKIRGRQLQKEDYTGAEKVTADTDQPASRFVGTTQLTNTYKQMTPGQSVKDTIKRVVKEQLEEAATDDKKGYKSSTGGLTQKGRDHYNRTTGSNLKAPVTTKPSKLKPGSKAANRRKSFCARMGGMKKRLTGSETANDPDSRINKALRKWNC
jgi:hypothetical protein